MKLVPGAERDAVKQRIVAEVGQRHVREFNAVKAALGSPVRNMSPMDGFVQLRALLDSMPTLDDAMTDCYYAIEMRKYEAIASGSLVHFGNAMWDRKRFDIALAMTEADIAKRHDRATGPTARALQELAALEAEAKTK